MQHAQTKQDKRKMKKYGIYVIGLVIWIISLTTSHLGEFIIIGIIIAAILGPIVLGLGIKKKLKEIVA